MSKPILFFDGDCSLCNKTVQFIITHEKKTEEPLLFCSLQSTYAKQVLEKYHYNFNQLNTLVLLAGDNILYKSNAALNLCKFLKAPYSLLIILKIIPSLIRDGVYNYIAKNRKKLIKTPFCYMPTPPLKNRFIDR